jgi:hypothetical protein
MTIEFDTTDRGFKHLSPIPGRRSGKVRVYESSNAEKACIWMAVEELDNRNQFMEPTAPTHQAYIELTLRRAKQLRDQLDWIIKNHYQTEA